MAPTTPHIVIIGAGIVGCALADELTRRGHTRVTVLEKGPLFHTGGSTSHAPGLVFQTSSSRPMTRLATATVRKYASLSEDGVRCLNQVGGLEVASTPERLADLHRRHGWASAAGIRSRVLEPGECARLHPLLAEERILGGLHIPADGTALPVAAARVQAKAATGRGAVFLAHREVTAIEQRGGCTTGVRCGAESFPADLVICCAGMWGPAVGELAGVGIPLVPMAHQYVRTNPLGALEAIHALESASGAADPSLPILRHQDADLYFRPHGHRLGIGAYGHRAMPMDSRDLDVPDPGASMPSERRFTPDDFDPSWDAAVALLPVLGDAKIEEGVNGVFSFTPDGLPLLGEHPGLRGFWTAEAVWITHSAGVAEAVAEWITTGRPALDGEPIDLSGADVDRFDPAALDPAVVLARSCRAFDEVYDVIHPLDPPSVARPIGTTPFHSRQVELRAVFTEAGALERPLWFEANAWLPEVCEVPRREGWAARNWSPVAGAEALVTRRAAGMFDLSPMRRLEITGPGAVEFLQRLVTNDIDRPAGRVVYTLMLDATGGVLADLTVTRLGPQRFLVAVADRLDVAALHRYARDSVEITDVTGATACLGVWGPKVGEILTGLIPDDAGRLGFFRAAEFAVGPVPVTGLRVSYVGEYGWELVCAATDAERLWDIVHAAGARHGLIAAGRLAFDALRIEKGFRAKGTDISPEHGPDATGLGFAVAMDKGPFVGRAAVHAAREAGPPAEVLATLVLDHAGAVLFGQEPVYDLPQARRFTREPVPVDELEPGPPDAIGRITSAATGHPCGAAIAYAWLPAERAVPGTRVAVELFGRRLTARVVEGPLFDPTGSRMRTAGAGG
ncbi:GcvT family protein [Pseudonocardia parietis]|uniref:Glycine cleavage system aminomethyltransferase T/glycine/D-amino acid oxidase-like deaminating enzyme n=1 Tax=Pseudonocardia parietis TaxID=570936 RepID=A0ABS4VXZ7_9PSEU|nr:FAD-dependent oxidoreductase [Pseudonocardia parietis]MBP2368818.1 glycine cleavage system aminomethyltransferase T/glycine/D-amino acid oxidase-like deaminating enzyme [Pseudonocardia parietis]